LVSSTAFPTFIVTVPVLGLGINPLGPKTGTVTNDIVKAISEVKAGKVEFRVDKFGVIHVAIGKLSFDEDKIYQNVKACMDAIVKAKPPSVKGTYLKKFVLSTTMGPGIKINNSHFIN
jgi:large subunit ribosomal protein L1